MDAVYKTKRGDTRNAIRATLIGTDGTPVNLTDCAVKFIMAPLGGAATIVNRPAQVQDAANGIVWFVFTPEDVSEAGTFRGEFEVTYPDGRVETFPNNDYITVQIMPDLG